MQLQMNWPQTALCHRLSEAQATPPSDYFCLDSGAFIAEKPAGSSGFLRFFWLNHQPVMLCDSKDYICVVDGQVLSPGTEQPLRYGMMIQAGHFKFKVVPYDDGEDLPVYSDPESKVDISDQLPELDNLVAHGGHYTTWQAADTEIIAETLQDDALKHLTHEYKRYLLWGDQSRAFINKEVQQETRLPARDAYLDNVMDSVKGKTMVECIFNEEALIERVIDELMTINQEEIPEEETQDILVALAPDNSSRIARRDVSELLYRELYKLGLDSRL